MTAIGQPGGWARSPGRMLLWAVPTALLATPAVMMARAVDGWRWSPFDFVFAAVLLYGTTALIDLAIRRGGNTAYRLGAAVAALTALLLVWVNGAVGVIGNEDNPANLVFLGVIAVALAGSAWARFAARGMAWAMLGACALTMAVAAAALTLDLSAGDPPGSAGLALLIGGFALLWGLSAALFAKAARDAA